MTTRDSAALKTSWLAFMDRAGGAALHLLHQWRPPRLVRICETSPGHWRDDAGAELDFADPRQSADRFRNADVELTLHESRVLFRTLRLPAQARDFVASIVAGQVDRLLPWASGRALHGSRIERETDEGLLVKVAGFSTAPLQPVVNAIAAQTTGRLTYVARAAASEPIVVEDRAERTLALRGVRAAMQGALIGSLGVSCLVIALAVSMKSGVETEQEALLAREASVRQAGGPREGAAEALVRNRKSEQRSATLVLETLAGLLPDDTYLTSVDMTGDRMVAVGQSADANALIGRLERSGQFFDVRFIAPTTRTAAGAERFQVEARTSVRRSPE